MTCKVIIAGKMQFTGEHSVWCFELNNELQVSELKAVTELQFITALI